jgi:hypothetical protein
MQLLEAHVENVNLTLGGLLGESGVPSVGKVRESDMKSRHLQCGSPRSCRLRTGGLASTSKY